MTFETRSPPFPPASYHPEGSVGMVFVGPESRTVRGRVSRIVALGIVYTPSFARIS
ncbi:hypothetical protein M404DRAFT_994268 [Pisolithus tinctorius Marx 270]|uniref:Uncharacterized protein n=1 Tax=Pisolithus tinctorius Marx 270 TaxID=870435 RepID=A0A0C3KPJ2_PISTI|nr:hypothetical protein M404DRAFT_994268 [Pisolithus tinctorius Marx 270]